MKKILLILLCIVLITGCGKKGKNNASAEFQNQVQRSKSYKMSGTMELLNDEETFLYAIDVYYLERDYYKVEMTNSANEHMQVILKNDDGLYVITPELNKSFKFESTWPNNSSQSYILASLVSDIKNTENLEVSEEDNYYVIKCNVKYPNNPDLKYQKIYLEQDYSLKRVEVYSENDMKKVVVSVEGIDYNAGLSKKDFALEDYVKNEECDGNCSESTFSRIESAIYPLYMPTNTYLSSSEIVNSDDNARAILTFSGDKNFVIVEENAIASKTHETIPIYGDPLMLNETIGALSPNSITWTANGVNYYIVSNDLSTDEMIYVASSLGNYQSTIAVK